MPSGVKVKVVESAYRDNRSKVTINSCWCQARNGLQCSVRSGDVCLDPIGEDNDSQSGCHRSLVMRNGPRDKLTDKERGEMTVMKVEGNRFLVKVSGQPLKVPSMPWMLSDCSH